MGLEACSCPKGVFFKVLEPNHVLPSPLMGEGGVRVTLRHAQGDHGELVDHPRPSIPSHQWDREIIGWR